MSMNEKDIKESYDFIAEEYESPEHTTCRNFDYVTRKFIKNYDFEFYNNKINILEIGAGNCWISRLFADLYEGEIYATDISIKMIEQGEKMSSIYSEINFIKKSLSAKDIVNNKESYLFPSGFDLIICGLCDPYINQDFLNDIYPLLNKNGKILLTVPTKIWAHNLRLNSDKVKKVDETWHTNKRGQPIRVPSKCMNKSELKSIVDTEKYYIEEIKELKLDILAVPSKWVSKVADLLHIEVLDLPIVTICILEKS